ncbi:RNA polymerase sigma-70 factor [Sunxiuqinia sp. A32]|uniref:RNA polymerase sigma-70 factor n=1 Tax=Sunxiuqinia sp. A32 TaxID=3461496 RepID=UPI0040457F6F
MQRNNFELLQLLKNGDEASFKVVYNHFYSRLFYFVSEYIPNRDIAENVLQDTFLTLWEKKQRLSPDTNLNAYLYTVAKNNSLKKLRDAKYRNAIFQSGELTEYELELNTGALGKLETSDLIFSEIEEIIQNTLQNLPPQCKQVFELSRLQHKKNTEIADELGISVKTVEGHITKAIKVFKIALKEYLPLITFFIS